MAQTFDPIKTARKLESSYREYIAATIHFDNKDLQNQLEALLAKPGYLAKGPFLESAAPYKAGKTPRQLMEEGVLCRSFALLGGGDPSVFDLDRPLYTHQERAIRMAHNHKNYAVVTGTGSGKTECFLLPILNDILSEFEKTGHQPGVRALILYPMNALANDQLKRLRGLLAGTGITFGRYTGETPESRGAGEAAWKEGNPDTERLPEELISREEIRRTPPNILLTNYSMLEYLLIRPKDSGLFSGLFAQTWRHLAIDEAHVYSGSLGTEVAYLIRRLKARIDSEAPNRKPLQCYATSATIGSKEDMPKVAQFAEDLFGEPFDKSTDSLAVITSERKYSANDLAKTPWGTLPLDIWPKLRDALSDHDVISSEQLLAILDGFVPDALLQKLEGTNRPLLALGKILLGETSTACIVNYLEPSDGGSPLLDLTNENTITELAINGLPADSNGTQILSAMVEVLAAAERTNGVPILSSRYHSFLRAPEGLYINLASRQLIAEKKFSEPIPGATGEVTDEWTPVYEVSVCRHCGEAYILGQEEQSDQRGVVWLTPHVKGVHYDEDYQPRQYYRLASENENPEEGHRFIWICPICGALSDCRDGEQHRFQHDPCKRIPLDCTENGKNANEEKATCSHCHYQNAYAIQPMRVSPEAAGSVVCYDLVREVPPFDTKENTPKRRFGVKKANEFSTAGSVICFSDRRQDAAYFAPELARTYGKFTIRQLIARAVRELCEQNDGACQPTDVARWIVDRKDELNRKDSDWKGTEIEWSHRANAWILDELMADDSRNSLEDLGVIRIFPKGFLDVIESPEGADAIRKDVNSLHESGLPWLTENDYRILLLTNLEYLRSAKVLQWPEGAQKLSNLLGAKPKTIIAGEDGNFDSGLQYRYVGSKGVRNSRSLFARRYVKEHYDVDLDSENCSKLLNSLYDLTKDIIAYTDENLDKGSGFNLVANLWTLTPNSSDSAIWYCDKCGITSQFDTGGVCRTRNCNGHMIKATVGKRYDVDRFYKDMFFRDDPLPLNIEEHTAQLSSDMARDVQNRFLKGQVNILSCTTTFELGVDVGDLRAVFMRNVPPSPANYAQRAGRTGRRAGMPGYAVTFARLRPHDTEFYNHPEEIIHGATRPPACYLTNSNIAKRHVFAIALSSYFRSSPERECASVKFKDFLSCAEKNPHGLDDLRSYLQSHPSDLLHQLEAVLPSDLANSDDFDIAHWGWADDLIGEDGRLRIAHAMLYEAWAQLDKRANEYRQEGEYEKASRVAISQAEISKRMTISVLAESGVLPKYGFPTDVVNLNLPDQDALPENKRLDLSRGLRQAVREYAPGSTVIANKKTWKSTGIRKIRGRGVEKYRYGVCPSCQTFIKAPDDQSGTITCAVCGREYSANKIMLIPRFGFMGKEVSSKNGTKKSRNTSRTAIHFAQNWGDVQPKKDELTFPGGAIGLTYGSNIELCIENSGPMGRGFKYCSYCGAAAPATEKSFKHEKWCLNKHTETYNSLGAVFRSDVLELAFRFSSPRDFPDASWRSAMWAILSAAVIMLQIPETELGATTYLSIEGGYHAILIYDDVPGGAGRAQQLSSQVPELLRQAYNRVASCTGCDLDSCCYGCLANYHNQFEQNELTRRGALEIFDAIGVNQSEVTSSNQ